METILIIICVLLFIAIYSLVHAHHRIDLLEQRVSDIVNGEVRSELLS